MRKRISAGSVFQKTYNDRRGRNRKTSTWYLKYYVRGKAIELSSGTSDYDEALTMLRKRMADAPLNHATSRSVSRWVSSSTRPRRLRVQSTEEHLRHRAPS